MPEQSLERALKHTCQSTSACWAAVLVRENDDWNLTTTCGVNKRLKKELLKYIADFSVHTWLSGALTVGRSRSRSVQAIGGENCKKLYIFPKKGDGHILVVGAEELSSAQQKHWRTLVAEHLNEKESDDQPAVALSGAAELTYLSFLQKVVYEVSGMVDVREVCFRMTALLAENFNVDLAAIWVNDEDGLSLQSVHGDFFDGAHALATEACARAEKRFISQLDRSGMDSIPSNWRVGETACILLEEFDRPIGTIMLAKQRKSFTQDELMLFELVAGILSGVVATARQNQSLQDTVLTLQETQQELQARIGAQKEAEARLVQAAKLAAVGEMAAGVAHELNNPLTTVVGFTELVMDELPDEMPQKADLDMVLREARRARMVVRRLLDFARQSETVRVSADLNELVTDVVALMRHLLHTSGVTVELDLEENLPWTVMDRNQIKQVILNLMHNALNAINKAEGTIGVITGLRQHYERPWIVVAIKDSGVGIPAENIEHIFEPFFTTRSGTGGTGLGLSVTYGIVTDHGGRIEVESQINVGSTFTVWLPVME